MKCVMEELESLFYMILHWESMVLEGGGLQLRNIGGDQRKPKARLPFKEANVGSRISKRGGGRGER